MIQTLHLLTIYVIMLTKEVVVLQVPCHPWLLVRVGQFGFFCFFTFFTIVQVYSKLINNVILGTDDGQHEYSYLGDWGPRFDKLADMYGPPPESEEE